MAGSLIEDEHLVERFGAASVPALIQALVAVGVCQSTQMGRFRAGGIAYRYIAIAIERDHRNPPARAAVFQFLLRHTGKGKGTLFQRSRPKSLTGCPLCLTAYGGSFPSLHKFDSPHDIISLAVTVDISVSMVPDTWSGTTSTANKPRQDQLFTVYAAYIHHCRHLYYLQGDISLAFLFDDADIIALPNHARDFNCTWDYWFSTRVGHL